MEHLKSWVAKACDRSLAEKLSRTREIYEASVKSDEPPDEATWSRLSQLTEDYEKCAERQRKLRILLMDAERGFLTGHTKDD